jgi:hypothetical protein
VGGTLDVCHRVGAVQIYGAIARVYHPGVTWVVLSEALCHRVGGIVPPRCDRTGRGVGYTTPRPCVKCLQITCCSRGKCTCSFKRKCRDTAHSDLHMTYRNVTGGRTPA